MDEFFVMNLTQPREHSTVLDILGPPRGTPIWRDRIDESPHPLRAVFWGKEAVLAQTDLGICIVEVASLNGMCWVRPVLETLEQAQRLAKMTGAKIWKNLNGRGYLDDGTTTKLHQRRPTYTVYVSKAGQRA